MALLINTLSKNNKNPLNIFEAEKFNHDFICKLKIGSDHNLSHHKIT